MCLHCLPTFSHQIMRFQWSIEMTEAENTLVILILLSLHQWKELRYHLGAPHNVIHMKLHQMSHQSGRM